MDGADYSQRVLLLDPSKVWFAAPRHSGSQVSACLAQPAEPRMAWN